MSSISRGETGSLQTPVSTRANVLLYSDFNHLGCLSMGSDFDADPQPRSYEVTTDQLRDDAGKTRRSALRDARITGPG